MFDLSGGHNRIIESIDRIADALCPDTEPYCDRITDACVRIAEHFGIEIEYKGNRLADALEAIAVYMERNKPQAAASQADIAALLGGEDEYVVVSLSADLALSSALSVPAGKTVLLDLGGHTLTCAGQMEVSGDLVLKNGGVNCNGRVARVTNGGSLTLDGADVVSTADCGLCAVGPGSTITVNSGAVTAQEVPVLVETGASAVINGGTLTGLDNFAIGGNGTKGRGDVSITINGGLLVGKIQSPGYIAAGVYMPNSGTFTMNGGKIFSSGAGIVMRAGEVNLNGGEIVAYGASGVKGKVGDSRVTVGPYAVVYDQSANYPEVETLRLNVAPGMVLTGTDGDIDTLLLPDAAANITDNRG